MNNAAKTRAARYTITYVTGSTLGENLTEKQATKAAMASQMELKIVRDDGVVCERRGRGIVPVGYVAKGVDSDAAVRDIAAGASSHSLRPVRETREQHATYAEDVMGDADMAERIRTGRA